MRLGNIYFDPLVTPGGHKIAARQRWTPTPVQLQILESIFDQGNGTPSKQKIKEITHQLTQHGQISETNVYNWFQNRRARSKRKQSSSLPSNTESEAEAEIESPSERKAKSQKMTSIDTERTSSDMQHYTSQEPQRTQRMSPSNSKSSGTINQMSFYEHILSNQSKCCLIQLSLFFTQILHLCCTY